MRPGRETGDYRDRDRDRARTVSVDSCSSRTLGPSQPVAAATDGNVSIILMGIAMATSLNNNINMPCFLCVSGLALDQDYLYLYALFDQRRVDIIDQVEYGVHNRLHIYPLCGIFYFPWHRHQMEETDGF